MIKSKLIQALKALTPKEFVRLGKLIESPFYNTNKNVTHLYKLLKKKAPEFSTTQLDKEVLFSKIFPDQPFDTKRLNQLKNQLLNLFYELLNQIAVEQEEKGRNFRITTQLRNRRLSNHCNLFDRKLQKPPYNKHYNLDELFPYVNHYYTIANIDTNVGSLNKPSITARKTDEFDKTIQYLNGLYFSKVLIISIQRLKHLRNIDDWSLNVISYLDKNQDFVKNHPILHLYYLIYKVNFSSDKYYPELKKLLIEEEGNIKQSELYKIYGQVLYYVVKINNTGSDKLLQDTLDLYAKIDKLVINYPFNLYYFNNVILTALHCDDLKFAESFFSKHKVRMQELGHGNFTKFIEVKLLFFKKEFDKALEASKKIKLDSKITDLGVRIFLYQCYFELKEADAFYSFSESFKVFVIRNKYKLIGLELNSFKNFISYTKQVFTLREKFLLGIMKNPEATQRELLKKIQPIEFMYKQWLTDHLNSLKF